MWSFSGFYYRGEHWSGHDLLNLFTSLGATEEQRARIMATPDWETPYEQVYRELTTNRYGRIPLATEYSTEDWPCMLGTWDVTVHQHPKGLPPLKYSAIRRDEYQDFCACDDPVNHPWKVAPVEQCPQYNGRD